jgi:hypothetical protein
VDKRIKVVPQPDQVLVPYSRAFKGLKEKQEAGPHRSFSAMKRKKERKTLQKYYTKTLFFCGGGGGQLFAVFRFSRKARDGVGT